MAIMAGVPPIFQQYLQNRAMFAPRQPMPLNTLNAIQQGNRMATGGPDPMQQLAMRQGALDQAQGFQTRDAFAPADQAQMATQAPAGQMLPPGVDPMAARQQAMGQQAQAAGGAMAPNYGQLASQMGQAMPQLQPQPNYGQLANQLNSLMPRTSALLGRGMGY